MQTFGPLRGAASPWRYYSSSLGFHPKPLVRCAAPSSAHCLLQSWSNFWWAELVGLNLRRQDAQGK